MECADRDDGSASSLVDLDSQRARNWQAAERVARSFRLRHVVLPTVVHLLDADGYLRCEIELLERPRSGRWSWHARYYWILLDILKDGAPLSTSKSPTAIAGQVMREINAMTPVLIEDLARRNWQLAQLRARYPRSTRTRSGSSR